MVGGGEEGRRGQQEQHEGLDDRLKDFGEKGVRGGGEEGRQGDRQGESE